MALIAYGLAAALWPHSMRQRRGMTSRKRFWTEEPSHRNAVTLYDGQWASDLAEVLPGLTHAGTPMFFLDERPRQAAKSLGVDGRFEGYDVIELGPLEGAHSYQLEKLGARRIVAIESNAEAFQRCVLVKNMIGLDRTTFLLGDCTAYLKAGGAKVDMIFASGILYHMHDPLDLIAQVAKRTDRLFLWTQYYDAAFRYRNGRPLDHREVERSGAGAVDAPDVALYEYRYRRKRFRVDFRGGNRETTRWLSLDGIVAALKHYGFDKVEIIVNEPTESGPAASLAAWRSGATAGTTP